MAKGYNTFVVVDCRNRKNIAVTQSARKAAEYLEKGRRIEVWNSCCLVDKLYSYDSLSMGTYIEIEREYIGEKQKRHEQRNQRRQLHG